MTARYEIIPAESKHIALLKERLRVNDAAEITGAGLSVQKALWRSYRGSIVAKTALVDGRVAAMWGCGGLALGKIGEPWLLTSSDVEALSLDFARETRKEVAAMLEMFPRLQGVVAADYKQACAFLRFLGFRLSEPFPYGPLGKPFRRYEMERASKVVVVRKCTVAEIEDNINFSALAREYSDECAIAGLPHPDEKIAAYRSIEKSGAFHIYGAFLANRLVGFVAVLTPIIPHYGVAIAVTESLFVAKDHRKRGAGIKLLRAAENHAREAGSPGILVSAPSGGQLMKVLPHLGYRETNRAFFREMTCA